MRSFRIINFIHMRRNLALALFMQAIVTMGNSQQTNLPADYLDQMKIAVPAQANRSVSFTNREAAYFYTQSHQTNHQEYAWFEGMNIAKNRVFGGYQLYNNIRLLNTQTAEVTVYPYKLTRTYPGSITETLWMFDYLNCLAVEVTGSKGTIGISLKGKGVTFLHQQQQTALFSPMEGNYRIAVAPVNQQNIQITDGQISTAAAAGGFLIAVGKDEAEAIALLNRTRPHITKLQHERKSRMYSFLKENVYCQATIGNDKAKTDSLNLALSWIQTTMNQLVTHQQGYGIYAGLPWFNEYWGRDEFISMPGATLVSGLFETARNILISFAQYQQTDSTSRYFGRVPNIVNPQNIDYHTTDGTPRFIMQLLDYVKYSGDKALISQLYPQVKNSIEGALHYWVDEKGYLLHEDNETWMDARDAHQQSYSPRSTRANDIQALWYNQLCAGVYFAAYMKDDVNATRWQQIADKVSNHFASDFTAAGHDYLADRLTKNNQPDFVFRPNQLFALDMISDNALKCNVISKVWQHLVYPWGVSTLDKNDTFFHPYHLTPQYHKDAAYHNGTIWPWLNGIAMQRMIEAHQPETAWQLFSNMNRQAMTMGVVGGLSENLDAFPHPGESWPHLTGAYLQAWSNAEQLRVWYQYFLGIRPDMPNGKITLAPALPQAFNSLVCETKAGSNHLHFSYSTANGRSWGYSVDKSVVTAAIDIYPYEKKEVLIAPGQNLTIMEMEENNGLLITLTDKDNTEKGRWQAPVSQTRIKENAACIQKLAHIPFAVPGNAADYPVMQQH